MFRSPITQCRFWSDHCHHRPCLSHNSINNTGLTTISLDAKKKRSSTATVAQIVRSKGMMCSHRNRQLAAVVVVVLVLVVSGGGAAFRADYSINSITQDEGTWLKGTTADEYVGASVSGGGDVDGDGVDDFVVGAYRAMSLSGGTT
jgi:hypothetical protein